MSDRSAVGEWDVIVLGGGGAGLAAAAAAAEVGARVVLFESEDELGGSTKLSAGMFTAAPTRIQEAVGIYDSIDRFYQHYMDLNQWRLNPSVVHRFCEKSGPTLEWLMDLGVEVPAKMSGGANDPGLCQAGVEDVWRGHVPRDGGFGIVEVLQSACKRLGVDLILRTRVRNLILVGSEVSGVYADGVEVISPAVVVATGGLAQNPELLAEYFPDSLLAGDDLFVVAAAGSRGDHIKMAEQVSAAIAGKGWGLLLITAYFQRYHHWQSGFPPISRIYVNAQGRRFMNEDASYAVASGIFGVHGGYAWCIFDEKGRESLGEGYADWTASRVLQEVERGQTFCCDSIADLARVIGVPVTALARSIDRWNSTLPEGKDPDFYRDQSLRNHKIGSFPSPIDLPPFYAVRMVPGELVCTHAGLEIDPDCRVLDRSGVPIKGLYAAGEAGGGVLGHRYVGGGNSVANALTMGRQAGLGAANLALSTKD